MNKMQVSVAALIELVTQTKLSVKYLTEHLGVVVSPEEISKITTPKEVVYVAKLQLNVKAQKVFFEATKKIIINCISKDDLVLIVNATKSDYQILAKLALSKLV